MWLVCSPALQNTHTIPIRMRPAFLGVGSTVLVEEQVTAFENVMKLGLLLWAPAAHPLGATSPIYTVFRFVFLLPIVSLCSFLIPWFFFSLIFSSLTISLQPAPSLYVSKSGFFTFQNSVRCGGFGSFLSRYLVDLVAVSGTSSACSRLFCVWSRCCWWG